MVTKLKPKSPLKLDPSRTLTLRRAFSNQFRKRFAELKKAIIDKIVNQDCFDLKEVSHNPFTTNAFQFQSLPAQLKSFQDWLRTKVNMLLFSQGEESWWKKFIEEGFRKGQGRVFDDFKNVDKSSQHYQFLKQAFNNPISQERLDVLAGRVLTELTGVTEAMSQQIMRELTEGLTQGLNPKQIAKNLVDKVEGIGANRARMIAQTETIRAHAEGQLDELESMGVKEVGVAVEFSSAHDKRTCPICRKLDGKRYTLEKARGIIPQHVCCHCCFRPVLPTDFTEEESKDNPFSAAPKKSPWEKVKGWFVGNYNPYHDSRGRFATGPGMSHTDYIAGLKTIKTLGGSTGAKLVEDQHGHKYVLKKGTSAGHLRAEFAAEEAYRALGVKVPQSHLYETDHGPVKLSRYIEGGKEIGHLSPELKAKALEEVKKHFAAHVLLANWDVIGASHDNLMYHPNHGVFHIDAGGALDYRAQGKSKGHHWNGEASEFESMRNASVNPHAASVFGKMTPAEIHQSVKDVWAKKKELLEALPVHYRGIIEKRLDAMIIKDAALQAKTPQRPKPVSHKPVTTPVKSIKPEPEKVKAEGNLPHEYILSKLHTEGLKLSEMQTNKFKWMNPNGLELKPGSTLYFPRFHGGDANNPKNAKNLEILKKIVPEGVGIKIISVPDKYVHNPDFVFHQGKVVPVSKLSEPSKFHVEKTTPVKPVTVAGNQWTPPTPGYTIKSSDIKQSTKLMVEHPETPTEAKQALQHFADSLSIHEKQAIQNWKGSAQGTRKAITENPPPPPSIEVNASAHHFYKAIEKAPAYQGIVYRGIKNKTVSKYADQLMEQFKAIGVGGSWSDTAPHCMSRDRSISLNFAGNDLLMKIQTKTGRVIEHIGGYSSEQEITGMPLTQYRIKAIHEEDAKAYTGGKAMKMVVHLEEI